MDGRTAVPVSHRNSGVGGHGQSRGHPGHLLKGNPVFLQQLQLLTAPAEQEGIAALQTDHPFALLRFFQQNLIDAMLGHRVIAGLFANIDFLSVPGNQAQDFRADQAIKDNDLCLAKGFQSLPGQQARVTGACAHQSHITRVHWHSPSLSFRASFIPNASASAMLPEMLPLR